MDKPDVDRQCLAVRGNDADRGESLYLIFLSGLDILWLLSIELEGDEAFVEVSADLWLGEDGLLHLLTWYAPGRIEVDKEGLTLTLGFLESFLEGAFEEADTLSLLS